MKSCGIEFYKQKEKIFLVLTEEIKRRAIRVLKENILTAGVTRCILSFFSKPGASLYYNLQEIKSIYHFFLLH